MPEAKSIKGYSLDALNNLIDARYKKDFRRGGEPQPPVVGVILRLRKTPEGAREESAEGETTSFAGWILRFCAKPLKAREKRAPRGRIQSKG